MNTTERAARALDLTHSKEMIGIHTVAARTTLACWLDGATQLKAKTARRYCEYLEMIVRS